MANDVSKILGESEPEFSEQFKDTLALFDTIQRLAHDYCVPDISRDPPCTQSLYMAIGAYERAYGESKFTRSLLKSYESRPNSGSQDDLLDWAMELQGDFIVSVIQAVRDGDISVASMAQSILSGHALDGDVDLAILAIANELGWERADIEAFVG